MTQDQVFQAISQIGRDNRWTDRERRLLLWILVPGPGRKSLGRVVFGAVKDLAACGLRPEHALRTLSGLVSRGVVQVEGTRDGREVRLVIEQLGIAKLAISPSQVPENKGDCQIGNFTHRKSMKNKAIAKLAIVDPPLFSPPHAPPLLSPPLGSTHTQHPVNKTTPQPLEPSGVCVSGLGRKAKPQVRTVATAEEARANMAGRILAAHGGSPRVAALGTGELIGLGLEADVAASIVRHPALWNGLGVLALLRLQTTRGAERLAHALEALGVQYPDPFGSNPRGRVANPGALLRKALDDLQRGTFLDPPGYLSPEDRSRQLDLELQDRDAKRAERNASTRERARQEEISRGLAALKADDPAEYAALEALAVKEILATGIPPDLVPRPMVLTRMGAIYAERTNAA